MRNKAIKKYVKERDEMLMKCSVAEFRKFVETHKVFHDPAQIAAFRRASDEVLEISLHKMIVNATNLPFEFRAKSAEWLFDRNYTTEL
jgi:hypothetical protein